VRWSRSAKWHEIMFGLGRVASHSARDRALSSQHGGSVNPWCDCVDSPAMGVREAKWLASSGGRSFWRHSAREGGHRTSRQAASEGKGLVSLCSNGSLAADTEEDDGSERHSSRVGWALAFPFPLL
jgi:hypothetical protein